MSHSGSCYILADSFLNLTLAAFSLIFLCLHLEYVYLIKTVSLEGKEDKNAVATRPVIKLLSSLSQGEHGGSRNHPFPMGENP